MLVSFVIPTMGRPSLEQTLDSVISQTNNSWEALVVPDGFVRIPDIDNPQIKFLKTGWVGSAGVLRNSGIARAEGEWIAFVDDDDTISPEYVEILQKHIESHDPDVVIFRMNHPALGFIPRLNDTELRMGNVGISFAINKKFAIENNIYFIKEQVGLAQHEDYDLIKQLRDSNALIALSNFCTYWVRQPSRSALFVAGEVE